MKLMLITNEKPEYCGSCELSDGYFCQAKTMLMTTKQSFINSVSTISGVDRDCPLLVKFDRGVGGNHAKEHRQAITN